MFQRIFYLDFIRTIATILIVVYHLSVALTTFSITVPIPRFDSHANGTYGHLGVALFFIISGAALMYNYKKNLDVTPLLKKRFVSLFPMFWLTYICYRLYLNVFMHIRAAQIPKWRYIFTVVGMDGYLASITPTFYLLGEWFLGCIILLYLLFPLLRCLLKKYPKQLPIAIVIGYLVLLFFDPFPNMIQDRNFLFRIVDVLFGMYFVTYVRNVPGKAATVAAIVLAVFLVQPMNLPEVVCIHLIGISSFIVLVYLSKYLEKKYVKKCCLIVSKYSYAIFLVHHIVIQQVLQYFTNQTLSAFQILCLATVIGILIGLLSYGIDRLNTIILAAFRSCFSNGTTNGKHNYTLQNREGQRGL